MENSQDEIIVWLTQEDDSELPTFEDQPNLNAIQGRDSSLVHISIFFFHFQCLHEFTVNFKLETSLSKKRNLIIELVKVCDMAISELLRELGEFQI